MRRLNLVLLPLLALAGLIPPASAAQESPDPRTPLPVDPRVQVGLLENGVGYYIRENPEPQARAELRLVVDAGSILEDEDQLGLAHFAEHMAFNGTRHFEKQELVDYLERIGMRFGPDVNAYTSFDETVYMLTVPTDTAHIVETAFQILEDWAHGVSFEPEEIDKERGVVIEEWRLGRGASARIRDQQFPVLFKGSRYAERLPIGEKEVLEDFEHETLVRFYRDWYRPDLMAVIAVGDFDASWIRELIEEHFGHIPAREDPRPRPLYPVPGHQEALFSVASDPEATYSGVSVNWKQEVRERGSIADYRRSMVESLYNAMFNARLFELTQQADPPFLGASSGQGRFIRAAEFYILSAGVASGEIERGLETMLTEAERVGRHGFTASELEREKAELLRSMEHAYAEREKTSSSRYASEYVRAYLYDEPIPGIETEFQLHQRFLPGIELEEVNQLASRWLVDTNRVVLASGPEKEDAELPGVEELAAVFDRATSTEIEPYEDTALDAPLLAEVPEPGGIVIEEYIEELDVHRWELSNGVRVVLKATDFKDDEIVFQGLSPGGTSLAEDEGYLPATTAATVVAQGGAGEFDLIQLQKALAGKEVRVNPSITELFEGFTGQAAPADLETLFQLIHLYFTEPRRDEEAFESFKTRIMGFLENRSADPASAFRDTLTVTLYQHHPRRRPPTPELYQEMDLDESLRFYRERFADASDFTFIFVGSFQPDDLQPLVRTYLATLPSTRREETWRDVGVEPPTGVIEKTVHRGIEPKSQTQIVFTGPFEWTRENRHAIRSLRDVLRIRLREVLREDMGGTYGVFVAGGGRRDPEPAYTLRLGFGADPDRLEELAEEIFVQIDSLKAHGPTEEELEKVRQSQRRAHETSLRENDYWLGQLVAAERYDLDPRNVLTYVELIDSLTGAVIRRAAIRYLNEENYVRVSLYPEGK